MNEDIQNFLNSYKNTVAMYAPKLPADSPALQKVNQLLGKMEELGNGCDAIWTYMEKIGAGDYMNQFTKLATELAMEAMAGEKAKGTAKVPTVAEAAAGYHASYNSIEEKEKTAVSRVYERIFQIEKECTTAPEFLARVTAEGLLLKISTVALEENFARLVDNACSQSLPAMAAHNERMVHLSRTAGSVMEIENESERLFHQNQEEQLMDTMMLNEFFYVVANAVGSYAMHASEENRESVEYAARFFISFYGLPPAKIFSHPRIQDMLEKVIIPAANKGGGNLTKERYVQEDQDIITHCIAGKTMPVENPSLAFFKFRGKEIALESWNTDLFR